MNRSHPFAAGFAAAWPEGAHLVDNISTKGDRHVITTGLPSFLGDNAVAIGISGRTEQEDEGRLAASMLQRLSSQERDPSYDKLAQRIREVSSDHGIAIHSLKLCALAPIPDGAVPTVEIEVTEIDDVLMTRIASYQIHGEDMPRGRSDLGAGDIEHFRTWCRSQQKLQEARRTTGIMLDPMLARISAPDQIEGIIVFLRKDPTGNPSSTKGEWEAAMLRHRGFSVHEQVQSVMIRDGILHAKISLSPEVTWESRPRIKGKTVVDIKRDIPETYLQSLPGKRLLEIVDHPLIDPDWQISHIDPKGFSAFGNNCRLHIDCDLVPSGMGSEEESGVEQDLEQKGKDA